MNRTLSYMLEQMGLFIMTVKTMLLKDAGQRQCHKQRILQMSITSSSPRQALMFAGTKYLHKV